MPNDLSTQAIVLRRTNYGETDRILNLLTPEGKISALAKGARKEKSRLAGGIELFSVADIVVHQGRSNLGTLTSAKMLHFYGNILTDLTRLELASDFLRKAEKLSEQIDNPHFFQIIQRALDGLHRGLPLTLVRIWTTLNLAQASGEEINLLTDTDGADLSPDLFYFWDGMEKALRPDPRGTIGANEIKIARLILQKPLVSIATISQIDELAMRLSALMSTYN